jgi:hypothetical protein
MMAQRAILDYYREQAPLADPGAHAALIDGLPGEAGALAEAVQGLLLHLYWADSYGVTLPEGPNAESQLRGVVPMLDCLLARDAEPLTTERPAERRLVGVCRHFTLLFVAMLRAKGIPARSRCGFADYFAPGMYVDHWVAEFWDAAQGRWVLADAQLDAVQRRALGIDFDPLDVPRDRFVIGGDAWARCRAGTADPARFGIHHLHGLWFVAGDLIRDVAALNKVEMLPWDVWGAMPAPDEALDDELLVYLDHLAALTHEPDATFAELRASYASDERVRVPSTVFNVMLDREEVVCADGR